MASFDEVLGSNDFASSSTGLTDDVVFVKPFTRVERGVRTCAYDKFYSRGKQY